jgi:hypothetical protein
MWKLTIIQKRKSEFSDFMNEEKIVFESSELSELTMLIERMAHLENVVTTTYKIEKVNKAGEGDEVGI